MAAPGRPRASTSSSSTSSNTHTSVGNKLAAFLPSLSSFRRASTRTLKFEVTLTIHCLLHYPQSGRLFVKVTRRKGGMAGWTERKGGEKGFERREEEGLQNSLPVGVQDED